MNLDLQGKKAIVTGASYGLGYACAEQLAKEGAEVLVCSRDKDRISAAANEISNKTGGKVSSVAADLANEADLNLLISRSRELLGHIDILVISTGHPPTYPLATATDKNWQEGIDLVLRPAISLSRAFIEDMCSVGYGRMIFIGSIFGIEPEHSSIIQSTLRTGLNAFSKCIANQYALNGLTSNVICPGYFDTPLVETLAKKYADESGVSVNSVIDDWKNFSPSRKFGRPEDLGAFVAFLSSPKGEFINGTSIVIDGGALKQY